MESSSKSQKNKKSGLIFLTISSVLIVAASYVAVNFKQEIADQISYMSYEPSIAIASIAERAGLSDYGTYLYFASRPVLDGTQKFNDLCGRQEQTSSILGCYSDSIIYLYDVTDAKLDGIKEVTAAHELLHAVYARINDDEKARLNKLLEAEYQKIKNDDEIASLVAYYERTEPGQRYNELHSVIGTKVAAISPELEKHYDKYFSNRSQTLALNEKYIGVFEKIQTQAESIASELNQLSSKISSSSISYNEKIKALNQDIASFNDRANSGDFTSQAQFYIERNAIAARVNSLSAERSDINNTISLFNSKLADYNALATESKELFESIDSTLAPAPTL
jgi:hypothetical protein